MDQLRSSEFHAADVGEAEAHLRARYGSLALSDAPLAFGERVRGDAGYALVEHDYAGRFAIGGELDVLSVGLPARGARYDWAIGDEQGSGTGQPVLFQPGQSFRTEVDHVTMRATVFDLSELSRFAGALFAVDHLRLRFASARPRSSAIGRLWASLVEFAAERDDPAYALLHASVRGSLTRLLFEAFPLVDPGIARRAHGVARWLGYRRAVSFIDDNASLPITLADIAAAAGLSGADLTAAFRAHAAEARTPLGYLRRARLEAARSDLRILDPVIPIREIALRWGFPSPVRFAAHYRDAFGVDPFEELRRRS